MKKKFQKLLSTTQLARINDMENVVLFKSNTTYKITMYFSEITYFQANMLQGFRPSLN